ncbi:MAG: tetratricopeptide repeat protein [Rhodocyclaceae bacterium]|jgi:MSHA biogenesis protein MshN|nr:tetratricopeptide repeat protein [Rhodocyclaceae bacterium]
MSVINQMLRDLDARQASRQERAGLPAGLRTLPPEPRRSMQPWGLLALGLLVGAVAVWFFAAQPSPEAPMLAENTPPPKAAPAAVASAAVEMQAGAEPAPPPAAPVAPAATSQPAPIPRPASAKPAAEKPKAPVPAAAARSVPAPPPEQAVRAATAATEPVEAKPAIPPGGEARIDKQPKTPPTREIAEAEYRKGMQAAGQGDSATALPALRRALELDPQHAKARQALLAVLANSRQWDEVKQVAQAGLALDPTRTGWATLLARLQYEEGDTDAALKTLDKYAAQAANDADFHALFAFLLQKRQRQAEAAQHYQAALRLRPNEGRWWFGLGLALEASGRGDEARAAFARARESGTLPVEMQGSVEEKLRASSPSAPPPN